MKTNTTKALALAVLAALAAAACKSSQARKVEPTTFLGSDAQLLQKGEKGQAMLRYEAPGVDWARYKSVLIDPVEYWTVPDSKDKLNEEDKKKLTDYYFNALNDSLSKRWTIARQPGPDTIRLKAAIVQAQKNKPVRDTLSSTLPQPFVLSALKKGATGKPTGVGEVQMEMKANDSMSGQLLAAAVDKRYGRKKFGGKFNRWDDVESALRYWSTQTAYRLCVNQGHTDCEEPTEKQQKEEGASGSR
jgi:hypothetical protein